MVGGRKEEILSSAADVFALGLLFCLVLVCDECLFTNFDRVPAAVITSQPDLFYATLEYVLAFLTYHTPNPFRMKPIISVF